MEEEAKSQLDEEEVGRVTHFFSKASAAGIEITAGSLKEGDTIRVKGHTTDFTQEVDSMQVDNASVEEAKIGDLVGIKTSDRAREHDIVYRVKV